LKMQSSTATITVTGSQYEVIPYVLTRKKKKKAVAFTEDVVDNEDMCKKKSKKCCIYHKTVKPFDESSDEDSDFEPFFKTSYDHADLKQNTHDECKTQKDNPSCSPQNNTGPPDSAVPGLLPDISDNGNVPKNPKG